MKEKKQVEAMDSLSNARAIFIGNIYSLHVYSLFREINDFTVFSCCSFYVPQHNQLIKGL